MFVTLWHYLKGYVIVEVYGGNVEKFLNLITYHGITLWQVKHHHSKIQFCILAQDFKAIKRDVHKARCHVRIKAKKGFPFIAFTYKKRHLFVAGTAIFIILLWVLTSFVWLIDIEGNGRISAMDMMHTLQENGYDTGKLKGKMNLRKAEVLLLNSYPDLLWVGIHYEGTRMVVKVSESVLPPSMSDLQSKPYSILSKRDALITYIAAQKGKPMVKVGDIVKKGDVLVAAQMPLGEETPTLYYTTSAKASIKGRTVYTATKEIALEQVKKSYIDKTSKSYSLRLFNKELTLYSQKKLQGNYDVQYTLHQLRITKLFPLPFAIGTKTQIAYTPAYYKLEGEDAKDLLLTNLWQDIKGHLAADAKVLKREIYFKESQGKITGTLYVLVEESIGYEAEQPLQSNEPLQN